MSCQVYTLSLTSTREAGYWKVPCFLSVCVCVGGGVRRHIQNVAERPPGLVLNPGVSLPLGLLLVTPSALVARPEGRLQ